MVQMPKGIPVACVAVDGADNAAILAVQMLAIEDAALSDQLTKFKADMADEVAAKDEKVRATVRLSAPGSINLLFLIYQI